MLVDLQSSDVAWRALAAMRRYSSTPARLVARNQVPSSRCSGRTSGIVTVAAVVVLIRRSGGAGGFERVMGKKISNGKAIFDSTALKAGSFAESPGGPSVAARTRLSPLPPALDAAYGIATGAPAAMPTR